MLTKTMTAPKPGATRRRAQKRAAGGLQAAETNGDEVERKVMSAACGAKPWSEMEAK
jgi:hypothetical protein